jgi:hypothetical protein
LAGKDNKAGPPAIYRGFYFILIKILIMTEPIATVPDPNYYPAEPKSVLATRVPSSVCFGLALVLFLLPFAELRCKPPKEDTSGIFDMMTINLAATNTGLGLAIGSDWKFSFPTTGNMLNEEPGPSWSKDVKEQEPNNYAIVALALAAIGFGLSFAYSRTAASLNIVIGILGAAALIGLMIDLIKKSNSFQEEMRKSGSKLDVDEYTDFDLQFTPWFYITIIAFLVAAFFSYKRMKVKNGYTKT